MNLPSSSHPFSLSAMDEILPTKKFSAKNVSEHTENKRKKNWPGMFASPTQRTP
jgi:hypothetical protein